MLGKKKRKKKRVVLKIQNTKYVEKQIPSFISVARFNSTRFIGDIDSLSEENDLFVCCEKGLSSSFSSMVLNSFNSFFNSFFRRPDMPAAPGAQVCRRLYLSLTD